MINAKITMGTEYSTQVSGDSIEEVIEKIKEFHTMGSFEVEHYTKKGKLETEMSSGWYLPL
jgi:hypothetical protein